jgi:hypothetical protein
VIFLNRNKILHEGLTFTGGKENAMNKLLLTMLGAVSAFELSMINERRAEGQAKARAEGSWRYGPSMGSWSTLLDNGVDIARFLVPGLPQILFLIHHPRLPATHCPIFLFLEKSAQPVSPRTPEFDSILLIT